jgi:hypothetical protein
MAKRSHASYVKAGKKAAATRKRKKAKGKARKPHARKAKRSSKLTRLHARKITITVTPSK